MEFLPSIEMFFSWLVTLLILFNLIILMLNIYFHFWGKKYTSTTHEQQNGDGEAINFLIKRIICMNIPLVSTKSVCTGKFRKNP
jgi:hypothetical protein